MGRETNEIMRDISQAREEIDSHLHELGGRVERARTQLDIQARARENLPQVLGAAAVGGLIFGLLVGRRRAHRHEAMYAPPWNMSERERMAWRKRMAEVSGLSKAAAEEEIP